MSTLKRPEAATSSVIGLAHEYQAGTEEIHSHVDFGQILYAIKGAMTVRTSHGYWVLPPQRALWIPPDVPHMFSHSRPVSLRTVYVRRGTPGMPEWERCTIVQVSTLVRALILSCVGSSWHHTTDSNEGRLARVLLDQMLLLKQDPFYLPEPSDSRAVRAAEIARNDSANSTTLKDIAHRVGASERTLDRLFAAEVGMGFGAWRRNLRLLFALERLALGEAVGNVASAVGYDSSSSFIHSFKMAFGETPARYFSSSVAD